MMEYNTLKRAKRLFLPFCALILCMLIASPLLAELSGRYGGEFMAAGGGARMLAMGGASVGLADDAWSLFWNPAGLQNISRNQAAFMHSERFDGVVDYDVAALAMPRGDGSVWSAGLIRLGVNGIPFTRLQNPDQPPDSEGNRILVDKIVNEAEYALFVGKSDRYKQWDWGVAPKLLIKHFGSEHTAFGLGADAGVSGVPVNRVPVRLGLAVRDIFGSVLMWDTGRNEVIAPNARFGASYALHLPSLEATIVPAVDIAYHFENFGDSDAAKLHLGCEYTVRNLVALRVGQDDGSLTFGGGIKFNPVSLGYAFIGHDELGESHRVSINIRWGD